MKKTTKYASVRMIAGRLVVKYPRNSRGKELLFEAVERIKEGGGYVNFKMTIDSDVVVVKFDKDTDDREIDWIRYWMGRPI
ncbi:hypothetical protein LL912_00795 [Niabella sp. CC-SYL272]|uniref:hypothetical protein n=1 Tax=Niabella agricola TaxID=2891571 RepID=UPI001F187A77|nr:hypothetical protein [Niabella agricola]MCF3107304.1 hypothetical protein [Niabella agricola]